MEFRKPNPLAGHGNGVTRLHPGVDRMMLNVALGKVAEIEKSLAAARDAARASARRAGVSLDNLFGSTAYVPRSTACRWRDQGIEEGRAETVAAYRMLLAPPSAEYAALGDAVRSAIARGGFKGHFARGDGTPDNSEAAADLAKQILAAAALRDAGGPPRPEPAGLAKQILDSSKKAHRKIGDGQ